MTFAEFTLLVFTVGVCFGIGMSIAVIAFGSSRVERAKEIRRLKNIRRSGV